MDDNIGGRKGPPRHPLSHVRYGEMAGEEVVFVLLKSGEEATLSAITWEAHLRKGYTPKLGLKPNGHGRSYVAFKAWSPGLPHRRTTRDMARSVEAEKMMRIERAGGPRATDKGWVAKTLNGNPYDLRDCNVVAVPANGGRNSYLDVWDARKRHALADQGKHPNRAIQLLRRIWRRANKNRVPSPSSTRASSDGNPPVRRSVEAHKKAGDGGSHE